MQSKLEELARKEEELRRINEALDLKKNKIMSGVEDSTTLGAGVDLRNDPEFKASSSKKFGKASDDEDEDGKSSDDSDGQFKGKNLGKGRFNAADEDEDDYGDGNFENDPVDTGKSSKMKAASAVGSDAAMGSFKDKF